MCVIWSFRITHAAVKRISATNMRFGVCVLLWVGFILMTDAVFVILLWIGFILMADLVFVILFMVGFIRLTGAVFVILFGVSFILVIFVLRTMRVLIIIIISFMR